MRDAFLSDITLTQQLRSQAPQHAHRTWSGAWRRALGWLALEGGQHGVSVGAHRHDLQHAPAQWQPATFGSKLPGEVLLALLGQRAGALCRS